MLSPGHSSVSAFSRASHPLTPSHYSQEPRKEKQALSNALRSGAALNPEKCSQDSLRSTQTGQLQCYFAACLASSARWAALEEQTAHIISAADPKSSYSGAMKPAAKFLQTEDGGLSPREVQNKSRSSICASPMRHVAHDAASQRTISKLPILQPPPPGPLWPASVLHWVFAWIQRAPSLSCSSPPAVYPSPAEDRLHRRPVCMQTASKEPCRGTKCVSISHWEEFTGRCGASSGKVGV